MKRGLKYLSILLMLLLVVTGCGYERDPREKLTSALEKTSRAKSFSVKIDGNLTSEYEGMELNAYIKLDADVNVERDKPSAHYNSDISIPIIDIDEKIEGYITTNDKGIYNFVKEDDKWTLTSGEYESGEFSIYRFKEIFDKAKSIEEVKSDKLGYTKLIVTVTDDDISNVLNSEEAEDIDNAIIGNRADELLQSVKIAKDFRFDVYLRFGYVRIIEIDLTNTLTNIINSATPSNVNPETSASFRIEFDKFNRIKSVKVPDEVLDEVLDEAIIETVEE